MDCSRACDEHGKWFHNESTIMTTRRHGPAFYILLPFFLFFFAVPYLFDLAYCEELYGTPLSQAALIEGEKVDPHEQQNLHRALDTATGPTVNVAPTRTRVPPPHALHVSSPRASVPVLLISRPPPML